MVANHYGRSLPQDDAALAARILNQGWEAASLRDFSRQLDRCST